MSSPTQGSPDCPRAVSEYADQVVQYVLRSVGVVLEFDSDTLPVLDHYLRTVPATDSALVALTAGTAGAYFGEVVRRRLGGSWQLVDEDPGAWKLTLPGGLTFSPAALALAAILRSEDVALDPSLDAPPKMRPVLADALERMGELTEDDYYSLCGRFDTFEHLQEVLLATAAELARQAGPPN